MKIVVLGSNGMLAKDIIIQLQDEHELHCFDMDLDITIVSKLFNTLSNIMPDIVINCAAYTNVEKSETDNTTFSVNSSAVMVLAQICKEINAKLIHFSTDYVFDGTKTIFYSEKDEANPINRYGLSKYLGEQYIQKYCSNYVIIRISWLFGIYGKNFVDTIFNKIDEVSELKVVDDQYGFPTSTVDVAKFISYFIKHKICFVGILHFRNSGNVTTWYGLAREISKIKSRHDVILPCKTSEMNFSAKRPSYSALKCGELANMKYKVESWENALKRHLIFKEKEKI